MTGHAPDPVGTAPSNLTTDAAKEDALTGQDHTTDPTVAGALAAIRGMHPTPHPMTAAAHNTHKPNDALSNTLAKTHHTGTTVTHLSHAIFPAGVTLETII